MKFSVEEIQAALKNAHYPSNSDAVIAILTRPKWTPQEGEVHARKNSNLSGWIYGKAGSGWAYIRPLTPDEVPALKVAIECLEKYGNPNTWGTQLVSDTLDKIKKLTSV